MSFSFIAEPFAEVNALGEYAADYVDLMFSHCDHIDTDKGPYELWRIVTAPITRMRVVLLSITVAHRERAYVLWDWDRVNKNHLLLLLRE